MGFFDGRSQSDGERRSSSHRTHSPTRSTASKGYYVRSHKPSSSSTYGSSRGIFGSGGGGSGSSYYKRRPREGYISMLIEKLRRMLRELWYYAKKNPVKAFFAVVVPLLSAGGAVHGILRQFGVRIPGLDGRTSRMTGGYYGSRGYGGDGGGLASSVLGGGLGEMLGGGGGGWMQSAGSLMQVAKAFM